MKVGILTVSDKGARGEREDRSGPAIREMIEAAGGTGVRARDWTPEATKSVLERETPGLPEAMRRAGAEKTPTAMLSRAAAGIRGSTLIVNLPGSEKAVRESLAAILPALPHGVDILKGASAECGRPHRG
jgi:molybdopterin biosynthesis enzyme MoaB